MEEKLALMTTTPEALIAKGIEHKLPVESMDRLLDMMFRMKQESAREQFFIALSKFQATIGTIEKRKQVKDGSGKVRYSYAPLEDIISQVKKPLEENGFSYTLKTRQDEKNVIIMCQAHHIAGHTEETEISVPVGPGKFMSVVQEIGSAVTYAKRYSFCNAFGIMTGDEDTDGETTEPKENIEKINAPTPEALKKVTELLKAATEGMNKEGKRTAFASTLEKLFGKNNLQKITDLNKYQVDALTAELNPMGDKK